MLVLSRKKGESIMIGEQIELVVVSVEGDTVRVGIKAPKDVEVYRKEIFQSIKESNEEAMVHTLNPLDIGKLFGKGKRNG